MVWQKGESGNPGGSVKGAKKNRSALANKFFRALLADFEEHGVKAIEMVRTTDAPAYLRVLASVMPKELEINNETRELTDEQLADIITALRSAISSGIVIEASGAEDSGESAKELSPLH